MARPDILNPVFASVRSAKGVGPRAGALINTLVDASEGYEAALIDVLMHMPQGVIDRRNQPGVAHAVPGSVATFFVHVDEHIAPPPGNRRVPYRILAHDETGDLVITYFAGQASWLSKTFPVGEKRYVSGVLSSFQGQRQINHPDYVLAEDRLADMPQVEPTYPLTHGLSLKILRKIIAAALDGLPDPPEWNGSAAEQNWPSFGAAMKAVHAPKTPNELLPTGPARRRLAYDELLAGQITLALVRSTLMRGRGVARQLNGDLTDRVIGALPFVMTKGQQHAFADIAADLKSSQPMARLLQGDVGSGKTVVALLAMAAMAEAGAQSAIMAPTELLAAQHFRTLTPLCAAAGLECILLTGKQNVKSKRAALTALADGSARIVVGTHALFQSGVEFENLGLTVVDEQHRFGVHQRLSLSEKGRSAELLVMTATPIPRTLVLTHFGDMDVSVLPEKPAGRLPVVTAVLPATAYGRAVQRLQARVGQGAQAFWVCPLVEQSDEIPAISAQERFEALKSVFGDKVGLVHGRMGTSEKQKTMDRFMAGEISVLVATTVIEVGVDVPNATIMVIEHAERFGLAQLHQLRGRIGRGSAASACLLLYGEPLSELAKARLKVIERTEDGFEIAEQDLTLRGQGDLLGTRQSGMPGYHLALPDVHADLLERAHGDARALLERNPGLTGPEGEAVRVLLYLFRRDLAIPLIKSG